VNPEIPILAGGGLTSWTPPSHIQLSFSSSPLLSSALTLFSVIPFLYSLFSQPLPFLHFRLFLSIILLRSSPTIHHHVSLG
jgi:hypothetical protein